MSDLPNLGMSASGRLRTAEEPDSANGKDKLMSELTDAKIYEQLSVDIRTTDDISFKLMGFVPLVSGTGVVGLLLAENRLALPPAVICLLSLFAAAVTLGLFRWELRNIQNCRWLIDYADALEQKALGRANLKDAYVTQPPSPQGIGKQGGEAIIYASTVATWLALPAVLAVSKGVDPWSEKPYVVASLIIGLATLASVFVRLKRGQKGNAGVQCAANDVPLPE
jgi:hypothetical protein